MRAVCIDSYGDRNELDLRNVAKPTPTDSQLLVKVQAASINPIDWKLRSGKLRRFWPIDFPFTPGFDVAGTVETVGAGVTDWGIGDDVMACAFNGGAYAEFMLVEDTLAARKPHNFTFQQAAAVPLAGLSALQALRDRGRMRVQDRVLVNGATGGVGHFAVQIAKAWECHVTAVTSSGNLELARSLGADSVVDYRTTEDVLIDPPYDVILDVVPNLSFRRCAAKLSKRGTYVNTLPGAGVLAYGGLALLGSYVGYGKRCRTLMLRPNRDDLNLLCQLGTEGKLRPIVEQVFDLEAIKLATKSSEQGHTRGKIVVVPASVSDPSRQP